MSRNESELQKRVDLLVKALEKEQLEGKTGTKQPQFKHSFSGGGEKTKAAKSGEDVEMSSQRSDGEDIEMDEDKSETTYNHQKRETGKLRAKKDEHDMGEQEQYNYLNDESAIRGGDGGVTPPFSDEKRIGGGDKSPEDEEFPEDDVDPMVYMNLVKK